MTAQLNPQRDTRDYQQLDARTTSTPSSTRRR